MTRQPASNPSMMDQVARAIAKADGVEFASDRPRYHMLALAALKPLARPIDAMIDAAHEAVWSDGFWAINRQPTSRRQCER